MRVRAILFTAGLGLVAAGCSKPDASSPATPVAAVTNAPPTAAKAAAPHAEEAHGHKPGAHGGVIVSLGRDSYHAEAVFEKGGVVRLHMLDKDEARILEVDAQELTAYVTPLSGGDAQAVPLTPEPQMGDAKGKTSQFVARLPKDLSGKQVRVTVNNLRVGGERFRIGFSNETAAHAGEEAMPAKKEADEEAKLFSTPGGLYTSADIVANGTATPAQKYKGIRANHDAQPKPGDKLCPISETKANPKFTWAVGGKRYEFCCVPCIEEFVATAKEKPGEIKDPEAYRKK